MIGQMNEAKILTEARLAALAKQYRLAAGKTQLDAAREFRVSKPAIAMAENNPEKSLFKLRKRLIEKYSSFKVVGPAYWLEKK